jgi:hypothetical protein
MVQNKRDDMPTALGVLSSPESYLALTIDKY